MVQQVINVGSFPNDATGDPLQTAFTKINNNFLQLFGTGSSGGVTFGPPATPPGGTAVTIIGAIPPTLPALLVDGPTTMNGKVLAPGLTVNGIGNQATAQLIGAGGAPASLRLIDGGAGNTNWSVAVGAFGVGEFELVNVTASTIPLRISTAGVTTITGGMVLDGFTAMQTGTFTATAVGIASGITSGTATYRILFGKIAIVNIPILTGPSNSTSFTVTGLPAAIQPATLSTHFAVGAADNSVEVGSATVTVTAGSGTLIYGLNGSQTGWTATGGKSGGFCTLTYLLD